MKLLLMIGWRNLWRNRRRSLVVISSVSLGIFVMLLSMSIMNGMNNQMVENAIRTSLGHVSVHRKGFQEEMKLQNSFEPFPELQKYLSQNSGVEFAPRVKLEGMIRSSEASRGVLVMGIDPQREKPVSGIYEYTLDRNTGFPDDPAARDILISKTLARKLDLIVGDRAVLMFQDVNREITGVAFRVRGLYQSPVESFDRYVVYTGIAALQEITGLGNRISEMVIRADQRNRVDEIALQLRSIADRPDMEVLTWKQMAPGLLRSIALFDTMSYIFFAIIFITVIFSVANTLIMAIMERFHEIGVMKSIGTRPLQVAGMVLVEALGLGLTGLGTGVAAGGLFVGALSGSGIDFSAFTESVRAWGTGAIIYPALKPMDIIACSVIILVTTAVAAIYPAIRAACIKPLEALHYI